MESNKLVEKLAVQVKSFQKGFEILSKSRNINEIIKTFTRLVNGSLSLKDIYILHRASADSEWESIGSGKKPHTSILPLLESPDCITINYYSDKAVSAAISMPLADSSFLGILIEKKTDAESFSDFDKITLQILLQILDSAYKSFINHQKEKKLIFELNEKAFQLSNLIDTGIELSKLEKSNTIFGVALERASSITNASSALIKIVPSEKNIPVEYYTFPSGIDPQLILNNDLKIESCFYFNGYEYLFVLSEKETRGGVTSFNELDQLLLEAISRQLSASIENEFLLLQSLEKERIEKEMNLAASIQQQIIPKELPFIQGYESAGINIPSKEVGGDYYDCIKLENGKYAFIIADVAGKGISAALLVNTLNAALYSYLEFNLPLTDTAEKLNKLIYKASPPDKYITFFIAVLEPDSGKLEVVNAGHNPILLLRKNGNLEKLDAGGLGLGMVDFGIPYPAQSLVVNHGDTLFLYTDGIPEAMNEAEQEYSDERMIEFCKAHCSKSAKDFIVALVEDVRNYTSGADQSDDITFLFLKRKVN